MNALMQGRAFTEIGAHAKMPANGESLGVCLLGDYSNTMPPKAQMDSLIKVLVYLCGRYKINPYNIIGHRDAPNNSTSCPGNTFYQQTQRLGTIRNTVAKFISIANQSTKTLTKDQKNQEIRNFLRELFDKTRIIDIIGPAIHIEQWGPYQHILPNVKFRTGCFQNLSTAFPLVTATLTTERTPFGIQAVQAMKTQFDQFSKDHFGKTIEHEIFNLNSVYQGLRGKQNIHNVQVEMAVDVPNNQVTFRYITSIQGIGISDGTTTTIAHVLEVVIGETNFLFRPVDSTQPVNSINWGEIQGVVDNGLAVVAVCMVVGISIYGGAQLLALAKATQLTVSVIAAILTIINKR